MNSQTAKYFTGDRNDEISSNYISENPSETEEDRILGISEVAKIMNVCNVTASAIMSESGHCISLHRRKYILKSDLYDFLKGLKH